MWAVGGRAYVYPEGIAQPFFNHEEDEDIYILVEMHYDNSAYDQS